MTYVSTDSGINLQTTFLECNYNMKHRFNGNGSVYVELIVEGYSSGLVNIL